MKSIILVFLICVYLSLVSSESLTDTKHWIRSCDKNSCRKAFQICNKCNGQAQCQKCIRDASIRCFRCSVEIYETSDQRQINGTNYLLCDKASKLQQSVCHMFCRGKFHIGGQCQRVDGIPLCICGAKIKPTTKKPVKPTTKVTTKKISTEKPIETTKQVNPASYPVLANNYSISQLENELNFRRVYDVAYNVTTNTDDLMAIKAFCNESTILCAGGGENGSDVMRLVSCTKCLIALNETELNDPVLSDSAYWYMLPTKSFGFAPNETLDQFQADRFDTDSDLRLSWHLDLAIGGWRLGSLTQLNYDGFYRKYLFLN